MEEGRATEETPARRPQCAGRQDRRPIGPRQVRGRTTGERPCKPPHTPRLAPVVHGRAPAPARRAWEVARSRMGRDGHKKSGCTGHGRITGSRPTTRTRKRTRWTSTPRTPCSPDSQRSRPPCNCSCSITTTHQQSAEPSKPRSTRRSHSTAPRATTRGRSPATLRRCARNRRGSCSSYGNRCIRRHLRLDRRPIHNLRGRHPFAVLRQEFGHHGRRPQPQRHHAHTAQGPVDLDRAQRQRIVPLQHCLQRRRIIDCHARQRTQRVIELAADAAKNDRRNLSHWRPRRALLSPSRRASPSAWCRTRNRGDRSAWRS